MKEISHELTRIARIKPKACHPTHQKPVILQEALAPHRHSAGSVSELAESKAEILRLKRRMTRVVSRMTVGVCRAMPQIPRF